MMCMKEKKTSLSFCLGTKFNFIFSGYVCCQNNSYWCEDNPMLIREVLWSDVYCLKDGGL